MTMATWEDVVCKAKELAGAAGRKVTDVAELTKQKLKIAENERAIQDVMEALGRVVYESQKADAVADAAIVAELVRQVDDLYTENERLQAEVDNYCGRQTCSCGKTNPQGAAYCNSYGKQL